MVEEEGGNGKNPNKPPEIDINPGALEVFQDMTDAMDNLSGELEGASKDLASDREIRAQQMVFLTQQIDALRASVDELTGELVRQRAFELQKMKMALEGGFTQRLLSQLAREFVGD